MTVTERLVT